MKKILSILLLFSFHLAQSQTVPQGINYQAVALDQSGQPIPGIDIVGRPIDDAEIGVRIAILDNPQSGTVLYEELHEVRTDLYGMFNLVIGMGATLSVDPFSSINWQGDKFLKVELSIDNDGNYALSAVQQLMSVPYAFLAEKAVVAQTAVDIDDADADPTNELQALSVTGDSLTLSNGNTVELPVINDADADPTNEIQVLSRSSDTIYLSNGGYAVLPVDQVNDADADPSNEIQTITRSGTDITLSGNGGSVSVFDGNYNNLTNTPTIPTTTSDLTNDSGFLTTELDGSTTNELQTISKLGGTLSLSNNGGSISVFDGDYNDLSNTPTIPTTTSDLTNDSGFLTTEVDGSTTNELQTISKTGGAITLSDNGGSISVFDGDYNDLTGTPTIPTTTSDLTNDSGFLTTEVDGSTTNELQTISKTGGAITLSDNGGSVTVFDGDYNNLTNTPTIPSKTSDLTNDSGFITAEMDGSSTNELQTLTLANDTLKLSNSGYVILPNTNSGTNYSGNNSITGDDLGELFGLRYTGNGSLGDYHSDSNATISGKFLNYDDFFLLPGDTFNIPTSTTVLFVQDTCYLGGVVYGQQSGYSYGTYPGTSTNGLKAASGTHNASSNYSGSPTKVNEGQHTVNWNEWALFNYLNPYQSTISDLNNDLSFTICASQYGEISGQNGGTGGAAYGAYGGKGGKGLIIICKTLIVANAIFDLRGRSGTSSSNTSYRGGAGGGGSLFISYEFGSIQNPIVLSAGGTKLTAYTSIPLTNGASGRSLFYER
ncbi:hypothetical protein N9H61_02815 [Schleiferiaceae bacterium]|nr:hypothetical protein [Schleiferiaceae bacterium]